MSLRGITLLFMAFVSLVAAGVLPASYQVSKATATASPSASPSASPAEYHASVMSAVYSTPTEAAGYLTSPASSSAPAYHANTEPVNPAARPHSAETNVFDGEPSLGDGMINGHPHHVPPKPEEKSIAPEDDAELELETSSSLPLVDRKKKRICRGNWKAYICRIVHTKTPEEMVDELGYPTAPI